MKQQQTYHGNAPFFYDVTLRDGNQALARPWNLQEKEKVFNQLLKLGVQGIEVGFAGASDMDFAACEHLAKLAPSNVVISGLARAVERDIQKVWDAIQHADKPRIHTFIATSPFNMKNVLKMEPEKVKDIAVSAVSFAKKIMGGKGEVQFSCEHFGDCIENMDFVIEVCIAVVDAGASVVNLPNTVERYRPMVFVDMVEQVVEAIGGRAVVSVHNHNDLGMATATTVESHFAGAVQLETTLNGLGERSGNTNMYEVAIAIKNSGGLMPLNLEHIYETAVLMADWADMPIPEKAPLIGPEAIAHRSGIHQDGATKTKGMSKGAYRPIDFNEIGRTDNDVITFTSQSGRTAVYEMVGQMGYVISLDEAMHLQPILKSISEKEGELDEERVLEIFKSEMININGKVVFSSVNGIRDENVFVFSYKFDGEKREKSVSAEGPIEACIRLLREEGFEIDLVSYKQSVVAKCDDEWSGRALSEIKLKRHGSDQAEQVMGRGVHNDTLIANMKAIFTGVNLMFK
ncbi:MAG: 2-isopropylmalate synthase [Fibrobacterales bacterium]